MSRILVVEDDSAISELITMNLTVCGYECDAAYDGMQALNTIEKNDYDLALLLRCWTLCSPKKTDLN